MISSLGFQFVWNASSLALQNPLLSVHTSDSSADHHVYHTWNPVQKIQKHAPYVPIPPFSPHEPRFGSQPLVLLPTKYGFTTTWSFWQLTSYLRDICLSVQPHCFLWVLGMWTEKSGFTSLITRFPTPVLGSVLDGALSALWVNRIPFPLAGMLPQEVKINNVNSSSFWETQCGLSVGEDMAFKGEVGKDRQSFRH